MAKALLGHVNSNARTTSVLAADNRRLRRRVVELESLVLRLQADNDRLAAAARDEQLGVEDLESLVLRLQADNDRLAAAVRDDRLAAEDLQPV